MIIGGSTFGAEIEGSQMRILYIDIDIFWKVGYNRTINGINVVSAIFSDFIGNTLLIGDPIYTWFSIPEEKINTIISVVEELNRETIDSHEILGKKDLFIIEINTNKTYYKIKYINNDIFRDKIIDTIDNIEIGIGCQFFSYPSIDLGDKVYVNSLRDIGYDRFKSIINKFINKYNIEYWKVKGE